MVRVKICGITSLADALCCVQAGADAIGLNFWSGSVRRCEEAEARRIVQAVGKEALVVGVFVDAPEAELLRLKQALDLGCLQLHGDESPALLSRCLPHAYKALRVRGEQVIEEVRRYPGEHVLLDAYVRGMPGGTGATFDWGLARAVARERKLTLAGGLTPDNVARAVQAVSPFCVDTASGVEASPGVKSPELVRAFIHAAKAACTQRP